MQPFSVTKVNHPGSSLGSAGFAIRLLALPSAGMIVAIHRNGLMVSYDGLTGAAKKSIAVSC